MASTAAFSVEWSSVTSLIICTRCPNASTCGALPGAQPADQRLRLALGLLEPAAGAHAE